MWYLTMMVTSVGTNGIFVVLLRFALVTVLWIQTVLFYAGCDAVCRDGRACAHCWVSPLRGLPSTLLVLRPSSSVAFSLLSSQR